MINIAHNARSQISDRLFKLLPPIVLGLVFSACGSSNLPAIQTAVPTDPSNAPVASSTYAAPLSGIRPAPTVTVTPTPRPRLDDLDIRLGLVAELGLGRPWMAVLSVDGQLLRVLSPMGMTSFTRTGESWVQSLSVPTMMRDALQYMPDTSPWALQYGGLEPAVIACVSPDRARLAYQDNRLQIQVWDLSDARPIIETNALSAQVDDLQTSASGRLLASFRRGEGITLFDAATGEQLALLVDRRASIMALSPTEEEAITVSSTWVQRWALDTRRVVNVWRGEFPYYPLLAGLSRGSAVVGGFGGEYSDGFVSWHLNPDGVTQRREVEVQGAWGPGAERTAGSRVSPTGLRYVVWWWNWGPADGESIMLFGDMSTGEVIRQVQRTGWVKDFSFFADESSGVGVLGTGELLQIDLDGGETNFDLHASYSGPVSGLAFSPTSPILAVASSGWPVRLWDVNRASLVSEIVPGGSVVAFRIDGEQLAVASEEALQIWKTEVFPPELEGQLDMSAGRITFNERGELVGTDDEGVFTWNVPDEELVRSIEPLWGQLSPKGEIILACSFPDICDVREISQGYLQASFRLPGAIMAISPDLQELVTSHMGTVRLHDLHTGQELRAFGVPIRVSRTTFSPDGRLLVLGGTTDRSLMGNKVIIADPLAAMILAVLEGQTGGVTAIAVSPDGSLLATGASDGTVRLWGAVP